MSDVADDMPITAIAPWFGGKRRMASRIIEELGTHAAYWEPFCGSMAVLIAKPASTMEVVNDLHGDLINLARVIRDRTLGPQLYRRLRREWCSHERLNETAELTRRHKRSPAPEEPDLERALAYFVSSWWGRNGVAGTGSYNAGFCRRFTKNGGQSAKRAANAVDSIPAWRRRLRNVTILSDDAIELIHRIEDAPGVVAYCDPPYIAKGADYIHDMNHADHAALRIALSRFSKTRVVVSYYDHPFVRELYDGWTFVEAPTTRSMSNQGMKAKGEATPAPELLLINGESYTCGGLFGEFGCVA